METTDSRLEGLFSELKARGFRITPEQMTVVTTLILRLTTAAAAPISNQRLGRWIGPLVCRSAAEQSHFPRVFEAWFPDEAPAINWQGAETPDPEGQRLNDGRSSSHAQEQLRRARRGARLKHATPAIIGSVALLIVLFIAFSRLAPLVPVSSGKENPANGSAVEPPRTPDTSPAVKQPPVPAPVEPADSRSGLVAFVVELNETLGPLAVFVVWLPAVALALAIAASRHIVLAYVRREQLRAQPAMRDLLLHGYRGEMVSASFTRDIQVMRQRLRLPSRDLDVDRTIDASAASATLTPIFATRLASPDYLVLIDRRTATDHFSAYVHALVQNLESAGVHVAAYYYDRDMRRLVPPGAQRSLDLGDFAFANETSRIVVCGDGEALLDMNTGRLHDWAYELAAWSKRVLLTPKALPDWGRAEHQFERELGLQVFPANETGAKLAAIYFAEEQAPDAAREPKSYSGSAGSALVRRLAVAPFRWVHDEPPSTREQDELIDELRKYLSPPAMRWLSALAVYPEVYWALTLHIGAGLHKGSGAGDLDVHALEQIAPLPWLRYGHLPDWLRERLIRDMTPADVIHVAAIVDGLFHTILAPVPKNVLLEIGTHGLTSVDSPDQRVDRIMLEFMERRKSAVTDYQLPAAVAERLKRVAKRLGVADVWGRDELRHMESAATEYQAIVGMSRPATITLSNWNNTTLTPEHGEVSEYRTEAGVVVSLPAPTYAVRRGSNGTVLIVDEVSFQAWERQRVLALRLSVVTLILLSLVFVTVYNQFFSERITGGVAFFLLIGLLYAPVGIVWLTTVRRFSHALHAFPTVYESVLTIR